MIASSLLSGSSAAHSHPYTPPPYLQLSVFGDKRPLFAACMDISAVRKRPVARGNVAPCSALSSNRL